MADLLTTAHRHEALASRYRHVRDVTEALAAPLSPEDQTVQSMADVSPTKWHRAHTSWFFETFLLETSLPGYRLFHPGYAYLFNSYYEGLGSRHPRARRGVVSRPGAAEVGEYRGYVDESMARLLEGEHRDDVCDLVDLGLHHEQQHQELLLMDIKHVLSCNVLEPAYGVLEPSPLSSSAPVHASRADWLEHDGGVVEIGHAGVGFSFDNESPRHSVLLEPFALSTVPVTCAQWLDFMADGGYLRPELWLSDGWAAVQNEQWEAPLYWSQADGPDGDWRVFTLGGRRRVEGDEPVCHVSYYEADAYARWAEARLPTEFEWEAVATSAGAAPEGDFLDQAVLHPRPASSRPSWYGNVWQWTSSAYSPYPGFRPAAGAVGEYNGKFMVNQQVLRGGCCVTPPGHVRATYRNFFPPSARWAFSGLRLAKDAHS